MLLEEGGFDALATRFAALGTADRRAVLAGLEPADLARVRAAMERHARSRASDMAAARRGGRAYAAYSPWLAAIVREATDGSDASRDGPTEHARQAIVEAQAALVGNRDVAADSLFSQVRRLGGRLFGDGRPA